MQPRWNSPFKILRFNQIARIVETSIKMEQEDHVEDIKMPDFEKLFNQIQRVSPLARTVIVANKIHDNKNADDDTSSSVIMSNTEQYNEWPKGFAAVDDTCTYCSGWFLVCLACFAVFSSVF